MAHLPFELLSSQTPPETGEEEQLDPLEDAFDSFISGLGPGEGQGQIGPPEGSLLTRQTLTTAEDIAQSILQDEPPAARRTEPRSSTAVATPERPRQPELTSEGRQRRRLIEATKGPRPEHTSTAGFVWNRLKLGTHLLVQGLGTAVEDFGEILRDAGTGADLPLGEIGPRPDLIATNEEVGQVIEQYGAELRRKRARDMAQLARTQPDDFLQESLGVIAEMTPLALVAMASGGAGALATGGSFGGAMAASFGPVYFAEKGALQSDLEAEGLDPEEADFYSGLGAVPIAMAESVFEAGLGAGAARKLVGEGLKKTLMQRAVQVAKEGGRGLITEGITEGIQEALGIATEFAAIGEAPPWEEIRDRIVAASRAGAIGGAFFGGGVGGISEAAGYNRQRTQEMRERQLRLQIQNFDPDAVEVGAQVGDKVKVEMSNGQVRWIDAATGNPAVSKPTPQELAETLGVELKDAETTTEVIEATEEPQPAQLPVEEVAERVAALDPNPERGPQVASLNIRNLALNYRGNARARAQNLTEDEILEEMAQLESIALDENLDVSYGERVTAAARLRALEAALRDPDPQVVQALDISRLADDLAQRDDPEFDQMAAWIQSGDDEILQRALREAESLRATGDLRAESASSQVQERIEKRRERGRRGISAKSRVVTSEGQVGEVVRVRSSGFVEVDFGTGEDAVVHNPADLTPIPQPNRPVELTGGQVAEVIEVVDDTKARVRLPDDSETVIDFDQIERIGDDGRTRQDLQKKIKTARKAEAADTRSPLFQPTQAVDARTGESVEVVALGPETAELDSGEIIDRETLTFGPDRSVVADIQQTGVVPAFQPGTQPSAEGRHINFLEVPEEQAEFFEEGLKSDFLPSSVIRSVLGGRMTLLPQPQRPGTRLYAVELPETARDLTDASKRLLGFIGGKKAKINSSTMRAGLQISEALSPTEVRVMRVPEGLRATVQDHSVVNNMDTDQLRDYLRRLTDLNFGMPARVSEKLAEARQTAQTAAEARIAGDLGAAEVAEIEAQVARADVLQEDVQERADSRRRLWNEVRDIVQEGMRAETQTALDVLNSTFADDLVEIAGIGRATAERIAEARNTRGGFTDISELLDIAGIGEARYRQAVRDLESRANPDAVILQLSERRREAIKHILREVPARTSQDPSGWPLTVDHPDIPGMTLFIDKEMVPTTEAGTSMSIAQLRETLGGMEELELPDGTVVERDPVEQLDQETLLEALEGTVESTRAVYHIRIRTPEGKMVRSRTIGSELTPNVEVPEHLMRRRPGRSVPPAVEELQRAAAQGEDFREVIDSMRNRRRRTRRVSLGRSQALVRDPETGRMTPIDEIPEELLTDVSADEIVQRDIPFEVLDELDGGRTLVVRNEITDETFETTADQVSEDLGEANEPLVPLSVPRRLSEDEILDEVVRHVEEFGEKGKIMSIGEWRSAIPGVYAEVRRSPVRDGYVVGIFEEPYDAEMTKPRLYDVTAFQEFDSREDAETWLEENGFGRAVAGSQVRDLFMALPPVNEIQPQAETDRPALTAEQVADPDQIDFNIMTVERSLAHILNYYWGHGFIPQPVRDYAVRFALKWNSVVGRGNLFTQRDARRAREIRNELGLFEVSDARVAAQRKNVHDVVVGNRPLTADQTTPGSSANDVRVLDGILLDPSVEPAHPARIEEAKRYYAQTENDMRFLDLADATLLDIQDRLVEIGDERRLGVVVDAKLGSDSVVVQTFEGAQPTLNTVPKGDVIRVRRSDKARDYYRAARDALGEMTNLPTTPERGNSPIDAKYGLDLVQDPEAYNEGLQRAVRQNVEKLRMADDGMINGPTKYLDNLAELWVRMKELGIRNEDAEGEPLIPHTLLGTRRAPGGPRVRRQQTEQGAVEEETAGPGIVRQKAYELIANTFSNISPYGEVMARAKLGELSAQQRKAIEKQADQFNVDPDLPIYRKVEFLMQNVWDPHTADLLFQMNREAGAIQFQRDVMNHPDWPKKLGLEVRVPAMGKAAMTTEFASFLTTPREMANRHPTAAVFIHLSERARTDYANNQRRIAEDLKALMAMDSGNTLERRVFIKDLLIDPALGDLQDRPADILDEEQVRENMSEENQAKLAEFPDDFDWYFQYRAIRRIFREASKMQIRNSLVRGFHLEEAGKPGDDPESILNELQNMKQRNNLSAEEEAQVRELAERGAPVYHLVRSSNAKYARPESEVDMLLGLIDDYATYEDLPQGAKERIEDLRTDPETPHWIEKQYDFWARFGIKNYFPTVLQGQVLLRRKDTGDLVTAVPDGMAAAQFALMARQGDLKSEGISPDWEYYLDYRMPKVDDVSMAFLGGFRTAKLWAQVAKELDGPEGIGAEWLNVLMQELNLGSEPATPRLVHAEERVANLTSMIVDPYRAIMLYWGRASRNNFLLDVAKAWETARGLDGSLSSASNVAPLFESLPVFQRYLEDLRDNYMGVPTRFERLVNSVLAPVKAVTRMSRRTLGEIRKRLQGEDYDLWSDPDFLDALYGDDYASRRFAEELTTVQSVLRLGLNFSGAVINSLQAIMHTPAYLIARGAGVPESIGYLAGGYKDMTRYLYEGREAEDLASFVEDVGVATVPARGIAGPGLGTRGDAMPIFFADDGLLHQMWERFQTVAMWPFVQAEQTVRLSSALAARRMAKDRGLNRKAAVEFARTVIDNTQFQYYDQALPPFMRGNVARILFQFQQFPLNAIKFEKDMLLAAMGGLPLDLGPALTTDNARGRVGQFQGKTSIVKPGTGERVDPSAQAFKAWVLYNAIGFSLGGLAFNVMRPMLAPLSWLTNYAFGQTLGQMLTNAFGEGEEEAERNPGPEVANEDLFSARNFILYGAPGLLGYTISQRLGVSGLDLDPTRASDMLLGPTGSLFRETMGALVGPEGFRRFNKGAAALGAGAILTALGTRHPALAPAWGLAATELASLNSEVPLRDFLANTTAGRQFRRSVSPNIIRGIEMTTDVFADNTWLDANFNRQTYPTAFSRNMAIAANIAGFETVQEAEERAYLQYGFHKRDEQRILRQQFLQMIVAERLRQEGERPGRVEALLREAARQDIDIGDQDIVNRIRQINMGAVGRARQRLPLDLRHSGEADPSGND